MIFQSILFLHIWIYLTAGHTVGRQANTGFTPYASCSATCMDDNIKPSTTCNELENDCICSVNDTYLEEVARCIATRCGVDELTATANLAVQNCALSGGWGNVDNNPANFIDMGLKAIASSTLSTPSQTTTATKASNTSASVSGTDTTTAPTPTSTSGSSNSNQNQNTITINNGNSSGGLSNSDRIALGVGLGIGLPTIIIMLWQSWERYLKEKWEAKRKRGDKGEDSMNR